MVPAQPHDRVLGRDLPGHVQLCRADVKVRPAHAQRQLRVHARRRRAAGLAFGHDAAHRRRGEQVAWLDQVVGVPLNGDGKVGVERARTVIRF